MRSECLCATGFLAEAGAGSAVAADLPVRLPLTADSRSRAGPLLLT
jgi:hypothetical protein